MTQDIIIQKEQSIDCIIHLDAQRRRLEQRVALLETQIKKNQNGPFLQK